jgi:putative ABC transport system substrate-binding protein
MRKAGLLSILFGVVLVAVAAIADAQQPKKIPRVGLLLTTATQDIAETFRQALAEYGYVEGKNVEFEYRYIEGQQEKIPGLVTELLDLKIDVLFVTTLTSIRAAKRATTTIPIVIITTNDPVATGIVDSLARPGGNITGITRLTRELNGKRLELLKEAVPKLSRVGVLWDSKGPGPTMAFKEYEAAAHLLRIKIASLEIRGLNLDFGRAFQIAAKGHADAIIPIRSSILIRDMAVIADLATKNRLPLMCESPDFVEAGGLISYSANETEPYRRAAGYIDRILKGAKPADLPVEQPTKFEFVINLKTAKQIGLTIPPNVLARADKVIR